MRTASGESGGSFIRSTPAAVASSPSTMRTGAGSSSRNVTTASAGTSAMRRPSMAQDVERALVGPVDVLQHEDRAGRGVQPVEQRGRERGRR